MKWRDFWYFVALVALVCLCMSVMACCPCRKLGESVESTSADSVVHHQLKVERINIWEELEVRPLAPSKQRDVFSVWEGLPNDFARPKLMAQHSFLENEYCTSTADIDEFGKLTHRLDTKSEALMPVRHITEEKTLVDSTNLRRKQQRTTVKVKEVRKVAWYDKFIRIIAVGLLAVVVLQNRKWIMKLIGLWRI